MLKIPFFRDQKYCKWRKEFKNNSSINVLNGFNAYHPDTRFVFFELSIDTRSILSSLKTKPRPFLKTYVLTILGISLMVKYFIDEKIKG